MADTKNVEQSFYDYLPDCPPQNETEASLDALRTGLAEVRELVFVSPEPMMIEKLKLKITNKS
jgi:hypothetical protein